VFTYLVNVHTVVRISVRARFKLDRMKRRQPVRSHFCNQPCNSIQSANLSIQ